MVEDNVTISRSPSGAYTVYDNKTREVTAEVSSSGKVTYRRKKNKSVKSEMPVAEIGDVVEQNGATYVRTGYTSFVLGTRSPQQQAEVNRQLSASAKVNRGETLTAQDLAVNNKVPFTTSTVNLAVQSQQNERKKQIMEAVPRGSATLSNNTNIFTRNPYTGADMGGVSGVRNGRSVGVTSNALSYSRPISSVEEYKPQGITQKIDWLRFRTTEKIKQPQLQQLGNVPFYAAEGFVDFFKGGYQIATSPIESAKSIYGTGKRFVSDYEYRTSVFNRVREQPSEFVGEFIGQWGAGKVVGKAGSFAIKSAKNIYVKTGAIEIPLSEITTTKAIKGIEPMPLSKSTEYSLKKFTSTVDESGRFNVVTASPTKIGGTKVGSGAKASANLEDPGIYVAPKGSASLYFTGIESGTAAGYSFNPLPSIKKTFQIPSLTEFSVKSISTYPKNILKQPGFQAVSRYQEEVLSKRSTAVITKRSMIGQGDLRRQKLLVLQDVELGGKQIKRGSIMTEAGTSELEAVIPKGSTFAYKKETRLLPRLKGFSEYTTYQGVAVPIRKTFVLGEETQTTLTRQRYTRVSEAKVKAQSSLIYQTSKRTPYSSVAKRLSSLSAISSRSFTGGSGRSIFGSSGKSIVSTSNRSFTGGSGRSIFGGSGRSGFGGSSMFATPRVALKPKIFSFSLKKVNAKNISFGRKTKRTPKQYTPSIAALFQNRNIYKLGKQRQSKGLSVTSGLGVRL